jgi:hypothetical protein
VEILGPNAIKIQLDEKIEELIKIIEPTHDGEGRDFLKGPLWIQRKTKYNDKLVSRTYHLINHHLYAVSKVNGTRRNHTYLRVSGRGNVNTISKDEATDIVCKRKGYVLDIDVADIGQTDLPKDPSIPYEVNQDW